MAPPRPQAGDGGRIMVLAGGIPLRHGNLVVGAVGVSSDKDQTAAEAAAAL